MGPHSNLCCEMPFFVCFIAKIEHFIDVLTNLKDAEAGDKRLAAC